MKKIGIAAVAAIVAGGALYGVTVYPEQRARAELEKALARLPEGTKGSYKQLSYSPLSSTLVVEGLEVIKGEHYAKVARSELKGGVAGLFNLLGGSSAPDEVRALADESTSTGVEWSTKLGKGSLAKVSMTNWRGRLADIVGTPQDYSDPVANAALLARTSVTRAEIEGAAVEQADGTVGRMARATLEGLDQGRLTSYEIRDLVANVKEGAAQPAMSVTVASVVVRDTDFNQTLLYYTPKTGADGKPDQTQLRLLGSAEARGVKINAGGGEGLEIEQVRLGAVSSTPLPFPPDRLNTPNPDPKLALQAAAGMAISDFELVGLGFTSKEAPPFKLGRMRVEQWSASRLGRLLLEGFRCNHADCGMLELGAFEIEKLDYAKFVETVMTLSEATPPTDLTFEPLDFGKIEIRDLKTWDKDTGTFKLGLLRFGDFTHKGPVVTSMSVLAKGLAIDMAGMPDDELVSIMKAMGYGSLDIDLDLAYAMQPEEKRVQQRVGLSVKDMGKLSLNMALDGVPPLGMAEPQFDDFDKVALTSFELRADDASLTDRALGFLAKQENATLEEARQVILQGLAEEKKRMRNKPFATRALDALASFVAKPSALTISAKPAKPVALLELMMASDDPLALAEMVKLEVKAGR